MMTLIANHLWQSTLVACVLGLLTLAFRHHRAQVRYGLWLAASLKFCVPFAVLVSAGSHMGWRPARFADVPQMTQVVETIGQPFSIPTVSVDAAAPVLASAVGTGRTVLLSLLALWMIGVVAVLATWIARWRRVASIVRASQPAGDGPVLETLRRLETSVAISRPVTLVESESPLEPGVFGILNPVLVWPRHIAAHLEDAQIQTILAHEVAHVRRRDNLAAAAHMAVQAVFWFHPLVWWIGVRLVDERERACDEDVVLMGSDPRIYAEGILKTCQCYVGTPLACVAGVTGSNLTKRIEHIMASNARATLTAWRKALLAAAAAAAVAAPVAFGALNAPLRAQAPEVVSRELEVRRQIEVRIEEANQAREKLIKMSRELRAQAAGASAARPAFDVTSVKPNKSGAGRITMLPAANGGWSATNVTLGMLVRIAFQLQDDQIVGGPPWLFEDRFDVLGTGVAPGAPDGPLFAKLQMLLADRFKLGTHTDTRELPMFAMVLANRDGKPGPKLTPSTNDCPQAPPAGARGRGPGPQPFAMPAPGEIPKCGWTIGPGRLAAGGQTMEQLTTNLSRLVGKIVVDKTNLPGTFDLLVEYTPDPGIGGRGDFPGRPPDGGPAPPTSDGPSIFTALQEQLGLRLESTKGPVSVLVIDRAEQPMEN
jgi:bla regulator protein blaR1